MTAKFLDYLDPRRSLDKRLKEAFQEHGVSFDQQEKLLEFLKPLRLKDEETWQHCIRVGLLAARIGKFTHLRPKALLYAGLLHDIGKVQTRLETLQKTAGWTPEDTTEVMGHVMDGHRLLRGQFDFSAEVILWHHRFQLNVYPVEMPTYLHEYCQGTRTLIPMLGRLLALADGYDAFHRINDKNGDQPLTGQMIKEKMLAYNKDINQLVEDLYQAGIFTTLLVGEPRRVIWVSRHELSPAQLVAIHDIHGGNVIIEQDEQVFRSAHGLIEYISSQDDAFVYLVASVPHYLAAALAGCRFGVFENCPDQRQKGVFGLSAVYHVVDGQLEKVRVNPDPKSDVGELLVPCDR